MKSYLKCRQTDNAKWLHMHMVIDGGWVHICLFTTVHAANNLLLAVVRLGVVGVAATLAAVLDVANLAVLEAVKEGSLNVLLRDGLVSLLQNSLNVLTVVACTH